MVFHLYVCSWFLYSVFLENIRNLIKQFGLGPEWLWTLYIFLVTDVNPIHVHCIPFLNVGISDQHSKDNFRLDVGEMTIDRDLELAMSMMQKAGLKSSSHNYPYKTLRENLKIEELSKEKLRVAQEIRDKVKERKKELRKGGHTFDEDDYDDILSEVKGVASDADVGARVFPERLDATDKQLSDVIKHRRLRHKKKNKRPFGPPPDSEPEE